MAQPVQLAKGSRFIVLASMCVVVAALYFAREVLIPLALAVLLTFLLTPLVRRLERLRLGRTASVLIVVVVGLLLVVGIGWMVERQFVQVANQLPDYRENIRNKMAAFGGGSSKDGGGGIGAAVENVEATIKAVTPGSGSPATQPASQPATQPATQSATQPTTQSATQPSTQSVAAAAAAPPPVAPDPSHDWGRLLNPPAARALPGSTLAGPPPQATDATPGAPLLNDVSPENPLPVRDYPETPSAVRQVLNYLGFALSPLATFGLVIIFVIFMLLNREDLRDRMLRLMGHGRLNLTTQAIDDAAVRITRYLLSQALINLAYGIAVALGLFVVGWVFGGGRPFPSVLLWGLLAGLLRFVPYVGAWVGAAGPLVVAFGFYEGHGVFIAALVLIVALELLVSQVAEPLIYGTSTGMSTLAVLVAAVFWTWLWGPVGLLLSTPLTAVIVVAGKYVPQLHFLNVLLGDEPVLDPHVRLYQRLLAQDQEEAADVARDALKQSTLLSVYDGMVLPALAMAEQDRTRGLVDEERWDFIRRSVRSLIDELGDLSRQLAKAPEAAADTAALPEGAAAATKPIPVLPYFGGNGNSGGTTMAAATSGAAGPSAGTSAAADEAAALTIPQSCTVNIVCLPSHDEADELAGLMLVQLLEERGYCAYTLSQSALASEMVDSVEKFAAHAVVVSALPPAAVSHARYLCKRLHGRYGDDLNMVVGLWGATGDLSKARDRITCVGTVRLGTSFLNVMKELHQLAQPVIVEAVTTGAAAGTTPQPAQGTRAT